MKRESRELKRIARDILNNRYSIPIGAFLTAGLIPAVCEIPFAMSGSITSSVMQLVIQLLARFLILLIGQVLGAGVIYIHLNMTRNHEFRLSQIFYPFKNGTERFFGAAFLYCILMIIGCLPAVFGGIYFYVAKLSALSVLILIAASLLSLFLAMTVIMNFYFVFFFLLDYPQMKVPAAFKECRRMMRGNKKRFLYVTCSFLGWSFLILCSVGIASLWINPYITQTFVNFYLDCTLELDKIPVRTYEDNSI